MRATTLGLEATYESLSDLERLALFYAIAASATQAQGARAEISVEAAAQAMLISETEVVALYRSLSEKRIEHQYESFPDEEGAANTLHTKALFILVEVVSSKGLATHLQVTVPLSVPGLHQ